jgi:SAM-dependent methyltransferase
MSVARPEPVPAVDSWNFAAFEYERDRYQTTLATLARRSYGNAYERGCSMGELTAQLARLCSHVTATDSAPSAVARTRQRCAHLQNVDIYCADAAALPPEGPFELIVLNEIGYYLSPPELIRIAATIAGCLAPGGEVVAVHWLGGNRGHVLHGDAVHSLLLANIPLQWVKGDRRNGFRVDSWSGV